MRTLYSFIFSLILYRRIGKQNCQGKLIWKAAAYKNDHKSRYYSTVLIISYDNPELIIISFDLLYIELDSCPHQIVTLKGLTTAHTCALDTLAMHSLATCCRRHACAF